MGESSGRLPFVPRPPQGRRSTSAPALAQGRHNVLGNSPIAGKVPPESGDVSPSWFEALRKSKHRLRAECTLII